MRYTRKVVEEYFTDVFAPILGLPLPNADGFRTPNTYALDYAQAYGGFKIIRFVGTHTGGIGESDVFGSTRRSPREMFDVMYFSVQVHYQMNRDS